MIKFSKRDGKYGCFSNFYCCFLFYNKVPYQNSESAFQAQKCPERAWEFMNLSPAQAKRLGRKVKLRSDWEEVKYDVMVDILRCKFTQNEHLEKVLLSTDDEEIVENTTAWHDNTWGNCECYRCRGIEGKNLLGKALMQVREELKQV